MLRIYSESTVFKQLSPHLQNDVQGWLFLRHLQNLDSVQPVLQPQSTNSIMSFGAGGIKQ